MEKILKQKIKKLWRNRVLLSISSLICLGASCVQAHLIFHYYPQRWISHVDQSLETLAQADLLVEESAQGRSELQFLARRHNMPATASLIEYQNWIQSEHEIESQQLVLVLIDDLEDVRSISKPLKLLTPTLSDVLTNVLINDVQSIEKQIRIIDSSISKELAQAKRINKVLNEIQSVKTSVSRDEDFSQDIDKASDLIYGRILLLRKIQSQDFLKVKDGQFTPSIDSAKELLKAIEEVQILVKEIKDVQPILDNDFLEKIINLELGEIHGLERGLDIDKSSPIQHLKQAVILMAVSLLLFSTFALMLSHTLKRLSNLHPNAQLIAIFPEEYVAELGALKRRMKKQNVSHWEIRTRIFQESLTLIWVFYIQVQIENLSLPSSDRSTDD